MIESKEPPNQYVQNLDREALRNILEDEKVELLKKFTADISAIERKLILLG